MTTALPAAQIAKATLRRLALERLQPTPENHEAIRRQAQGSGATARAPLVAIAAARAAVVISSTQVAELMERVVHGPD